MQTMLNENLVQQVEVQVLLLNHWNFQRNALYGKQYTAPQVHDKIL